jgi:hypothetical protein
MARNDTPASFTRFEEHLQEGRKAVGLKSAPEVIDVRGKWTDHSAPFCAACTWALQHGERHFPDLAFTAKEMTADEGRIELLGQVEEALVTSLKDVRAEKAALRLQFLDRAGQVYTSLDCRVRDPQTKEPTRAALRNLQAKPKGVLEASFSSRNSKRKSTTARTAGLKADNARLAEENLLLREGTVAGGAPAPTPARSGRRGRTR